MSNSPIVIADEDEDIVNINWRNSSHPFFVNVNSTTLAELKHLIELNLNIPVAHQKFVSGVRFNASRSRQEQEYDALSTLGVSANSTLNVMGPTRDELSLQPNLDNVAPQTVSQGHDVISVDDDDVIDDDDVQMVEPPAPKPVMSEQFSVKKFILGDQVHKFDSFVFENVSFDIAFDTSKAQDKILATIIYSSTDDKSLQFCTYVEYMHILPKIHSEKY
jgi:hypothetical protein